MKRIFYLVAVLPLFLLASHCEDDDNVMEPVDLLPPPTETGENTFGCLWDGEAYIPRCLYLHCGGSGISVSYTHFENGWYFLLKTRRDVNNEPKKKMAFFIDSVEFTQDYQTFVFGNHFPEDEQKLGVFTVSLFYDHDNIITTPSIEYGSYIGSGEIIMKLTDEGIASGTFWFDAVTEDGLDTIKIREGRFDLLLR